MSDNNAASTSGFSGTPYFGAGQADTSSPFQYSGLSLKSPGINFCVLQPDSQACHSAPLFGGAAVLFGGVLFLFLAGYLFGAIFGKSKTVNKLVEAKLSKDSLLKWSHYQTSKTITYLLVLSGIYFLVVGVSGTIELEFDEAKIVTSLPGVVLIFLGYRVWSKLEQPDT